MLVLSRKSGEAVVLPQCGVVVTVLEVRGNKIRLGITAPSHVQVDREEVWRRRSENALTAEAADPALVRATK